MKLSVIIPCYNGANTLGAQLEALAGQSWDEPWEVIVVDNGSTDDSPRVAEGYRPRLPNLQVVDAPQKKGPSYATNVGARVAVGDAFLFVDADDEVAPGWLSAMGRALETYPFVACRLDGVKLNENWLHQSRNLTQHAGLQPFPFPPYLPHAGAGTMGIRREVFEAEGGFDEDLIANQDAFFCLCVQLQGTPLHFVPDAVVHTRYRSKFAEIYRQGQSYGQYEVLVYKKALALGMPKIPHPWREAAKSWWMLAKNLRWLRTRGMAAWYAFTIGYRVGRVRGSFKQGIAAF